MVDKKKIRRSNLVRNGLELSYLNDDCAYYVSVYVNDIHCVYISIGNLFDTYLGFNIIKNYGCSAKECLEYFKKRITPNIIPAEYCVEIYKELLDDPELCNRLQSCINNIPENLYHEEYRIIEEARIKCYEKIKAAYDAAQKEFAETLLATAHSRRNIELIALKAPLPKSKKLIYRQMIFDDKSGK